MMNSIISLIKVGAAKVADLYSMQANPWEPLDRQSLPLTLRPLKDREAECWLDLQSFWFFNEIVAHRIPQDRVPPLLDTGDQATWQGIYTAMLAFKYTRAKSDNLAQLIANALNGMYQHQWFHGEGKARLIRGYDRRNNNSWQDDASNDTLTGHVAGLYFVLRYGPVELKGKALQLLSGIASELIDNNLCMIKADKTPTTYGVLVDGALTDPMRMTLLLAVLTIAKNYGLHGLAAKACDEVYGRYAAMIPYPKMVLGTLENWNDDHRAAIHLTILAMEDKRQRTQELAHAGLVRLWNITRERGNIWVNALIALGLGDAMPPAMRGDMAGKARMILGEFELKSKQWDTEVNWTGTLSGTVWSGAPVHSVTNGSWTPRIITISGTPRARQPLPSWACGKQDFIWQRHRYSCQDWIGQTAPTQRFNGGDFLAAYHLSVMTGILTPTE